MNYELITTNSLQIDRFEKLLYEGLPPFLLLPAPAIPAKRGGGQKALGLLIELIRPIGMFLVQDSGKPAIQHQLNCGSRLIGSGQLFWRLAEYIPIINS